MSTHVWTRIPLRIRLVWFVPEERADDEIPDHILEYYEEAAAWWLRVAGIEFILVNSGVEVFVDGFSGRPDEVRDWRTVLDQLYQTGASWLTVVFVPSSDLAYNLSANGYDRELDFGGFAFFARPDRDQFGYGAIVDSTKQSSSWSVVAHEIGHCLGLWHTLTGGGEYTNSSYLGAECAKPFADDTPSLSDAEVSLNLMNGSGQLVEGLSSSTTELTASQIARARLTVVSRDCPFARLFDVEPNYQGDRPVMDDISAPFVTQFFGRN